VSTTVDWVIPPGSTISKVEIKVYRVTFPGGKRREDILAGSIIQAPPVLPLIGSMTFSTGIAVPGTYCVRARLRYLNGVNSFEMPLKSADFNL
jgi:hypothetical protein